MNPNWNKVILQGLVGNGLVGYNAIKTLIETFSSDVVKDYAEFFPNISFIDNGIIENQCVRLFFNKINNNEFYLINGPQPRSEEMNSFFLKQIVADIKELHSSKPIDIFISFGALITKNLSYVDFQDIKHDSKEELAEKILFGEIEKDRSLHIATNGSITFENFLEGTNDSSDKLVKETQGFIKGLNGVLPAMVGERLKIPTVTIMVETTGTDPRDNSFPVLAQFLGLLATKKALHFIQNVFIGKNEHIDSKIDSVINDLKDAAKQELINYLDNDFSPDKTREADYRNDKMYT